MSEFVAYMRSESQDLHYDYDFSVLVLKFGGKSEVPDLYFGRFL